MFRGLRTLHLLTGLTLAVTLAIYTATGLVMNYRSWIPEHTERARRAVRLAFEASELADDTALARITERARDQLGLRGRSDVKRLPDGRVRIAFWRPAVREHLLLSPGGNGAELETVRVSAAQTLSSLHQLSGYHGGAAFAAWALLVDVTAVAALLFAVTGVALWWITRRDRLGMLLLAASTSYTVATILFLVLSE